MKERTSSMIFWRTVQLEIEKGIVEISTGLRKVTGHCGGVGPSATKEEMSKPQTAKRNMMVVHLDRLAPYKGTTQGKLP
jgi:hypothetical protein